MRSKKIIYTLLVVMLVVLASPQLFAGDSNRLGTASGVQVLVPVGPKDLAMGGANIAYTNGIEAIHWNPAGVSNLGYKASGLASTMQIFNTINVNYLALGFNAGNLGNLAFSLKSFDFGDIPLTTEEDMDGASGATYSPSFVTVGLTYAKKLTNTIGIGLTTKLISESVPRASATAVAFDFGIQYDGLGGLDGVAFGITVKNIGTNMKYEGSALLSRADQDGSKYTDYRKIETASADLPTSVEFGLGYKRNVMEKADMTLSTVFMNHNYGYDQLKFGAEYMYDNMLAIRAGYVSSMDMPSDEALHSVTFGAGFTYKVGTATLGLDYVFRPAEYFDAENMFALRVGF